MLGIHKSIALAFVSLLSISAQAQDYTPQFNWPVPATVLVREKILKKGNRMVISYNMNISKENDKLRVSLTDLKYLTFNGIPATDPRLQELKQLEKKMSASLPIFLVTLDGHFLELKNYEAIAGTLGNFVKDKAEYDKALKNPDVRRIVEQKSGEYWLSWTELWSSVVVSKGVASSVYLPGFRLLDIFKPAHYQYTFHGPCAKSKQCIDISATFKLSEQDGADLVREGTSTFAKKPIKPQSVPITQTFRTKIDYATLKPYEVLSRMESKITLDSKEKDVLEEHEYFFDWPK